MSLPAAPQPNVAYTISYTTQTDQDLTLSSVVRPAGGLPCASSYELEQQQNQTEDDVFGGGTSVFGGPTTTSATDTESAGPYLICSWIEGPDSGEVDAATTTPIYVGTPPPPPAPLGSAPPPSPAPALTSTTELATILHWPSSRYPAARGYWICPQAQIGGGSGLCMAEVRAGAKWHALSAVVSVTGGKLTLKYESDRSWRRHWSRFSRKLLAGFHTPGIASVNEPAYDWSWLAAGVRYGALHHRHGAFSAVAWDGNSSGLLHLERFTCRRRGRMIVCTIARRRHALPAMGRPGASRRETAGSTALAAGLMSAERPSTAPQPLRQQRWHPGRRRRRRGGSAPAGAAAATAPRGRAGCGAARHR